MPFNEITRPKYLKNTPALIVAIEIYPIKL
jgi:hypothetical protein